MLKTLKVLNWFIQNFFLIHLQPVVEKNCHLYVNSSETSLIRTLKFFSISVKPVDVAAIKDALIIS